MANIYSAASARGGAHDLDRAAHRRKDAPWLTARRGAADARLLPIFEGRVPCDADGALASLAAADRPDLFAADRPWAYLGEAPSGGWFAAAVAEEADAPPGATYRSLREVGPQMEAGAAALAALARGLMDFHARHPFCPGCGTANVATDAGFARKCHSCGLTCFPRMDPAVIMVVERRDPGGDRMADRCLLGRAPHFYEGMYSTLAGFLEPGESLEDAVRRETFEEAGVRVGAVRYHSSQPWPFPHSLMVGFVAEAETDALTIDTDELVDAFWVDRATLRAPGGPKAFKLPRVDSIARRLIEDWAAEG